MPDLPEDPTPREVLIALNAHVASCATFQKINLGFMAAVFATLLAFAGYTYNQNEELKQKQILAVQASGTAAEQTRAVAQAVGAPIVPEKPLPPKD